MPLPLAPADTSFSIASTGTDTLAYRVIVAAPWATVAQESTGTVAAGTSVSVALRASAGSMAPSLYQATLTIQTNAPSGVVADPTAASSFETGSVLTLQWELRIVQALLFPTEVNLTVTPGTPAVAADFFLVNFAGMSILGLFPQGAASSVSATAASVTVRESQLGTFTLAAVYPTDANGAYSTPGQYTVNISILCWKEATESDIVNVTAGSQVSPLARSGASYVPITLPQITVLVMATPGAPNAALSSASLVTPASTLVLVPIVLRVSVRDAGNFSVPFDVAFDSVSLSAAPLLLENAVHLSLDDVWNSSVVEYTLLPVAVGPVTIRITLGGVSVPGGVVALTVLGPVCTGDLVLDPVSLTCVCGSGMYKNNNACAPCPAGSYNPSPGNGSSAQCLPCQAGWYCERGSVAGTASCPSGKGFDCSDGTLRTRDGYWTPLPSNLSANVSWALYECDNPHACPAVRVEPGAAQCAAGYAGSACGKCAPGYVKIGTFCVQCRYPGLEAVGVAIPPVLMVLAVALVIALVLEESGHLVSGRC
ncbi:MAG: hypothetical protein P4L87_10805 [Formivibrio sp.]|nr:hypothetical protein [Formivibrio sp.]